jgi:two-component system, chemotaxis family, chemotaxis protein CheY
MARDSHFMTTSMLNEISVLVIDDQRTMRAIIRQLLRQVGVNAVVEAGNGQEGLDLILDVYEKLPDVIICDLHMDTMDGMEFVNRLRRNKKQEINTLPVLIFTGDGDRFLHDVTEQAGATKILTKPISAPALKKEIEIATGFSAG